MGGGAVPPGRNVLPPLPGRGWVIAGKAFGAMMWTWIFYRGYHDGAALIVCLAVWLGNAKRSLLAHL
jgi:hypothetical protein